MPERSLNDAPQFSMRILTLQIHLGFYCKVVSEISSLGGRKGVGRTMGSFGDEIPAALVLIDMHIRSVLSGWMIDIRML